MEKRRILLEDGRYLIYYSFEESILPPDTDATDPQHEPPQPEGDAHE